MKKSTIAIMAAAMSVLAFAQTIDTYRFAMSLKVPRIYDNNESKGYRKLQTQKFVGELQFIYEDDGSTSVKVKNLSNNTHKIKGSPISYVCYDYPYSDHQPLIVGIGSNKTMKFDQGGAEFAFQADPSYNIGGIDEDNTLLLELSGYGKISDNVLKSIKGSVRGQIGCGCMAYGHVSPTRLFLGGITSVVHDVAPLYGTFTATFQGRKTKKE